MTTSMHFALVKLIPALLIVAVVGCGGDSSVGSVQGTITLNGRPIENATVTYVPKQGGSPSHARTDADGYYELRYTRAVAGAEIGEHKVTISTYRAPNPDAEPPTAAVPEQIPVTYNQHSTLFAHVKSGRNDIDFPLTSTSPIRQPDGRQAAARPSGNSALR